MTTQLSVGELMATTSKLKSQGGEFILPQLPYSRWALDPVISARSVGFHWGKHLQGYIDNLNRLVVGTPFESSSLEEICAKASGAIYNNGAKVWNHLFYFEGFSSDMRDSSPRGSLVEDIVRDFGSFVDFQTEFVDKGVAQFGSGWVWLCCDGGGRLSVVATANGDNPIRDDLRPLLCFDLWEHAYYLDYQNRRADHLKDLWQIVDWGVVGQRLEIAERG